MEGGGEAAVAADFAYEAGAAFGNEEITGAVEGEGGRGEEPGVASRGAVRSWLGFAAGDGLDGGLRGEQADTTGIGAVRGIGEGDVAARVGGEAVGSEGVGGCAGGESVDDAAGIDVADAVAEGATERGGAPGRDDCPRRRRGWRCGQRPSGRLLSLSWACRRGAETGERGGSAIGVAGDAGVVGVGTLGDVELSRRRWRGGWHRWRGRRRFQQLVGGGAVDHGGGVLVDEDVAAGIGGEVSDEADGALQGGAVAVHAAAAGNASTATLVMMPRVSMWWMWNGCVGEERLPGIERRG